jgi:hypothetical protein
MTLAPLTKEGISTHPLLSVVSPVICTNSQRVDEFYAEIKNRSGEGIVLRDPKAWYFAKDSFLSEKVCRHA